MKQFNLKIITPKRIIIDEKVESITMPSKSGEITILANHIPLFSLLVDGIIKLRNGEEERYFAIGGGYVETDGKEVTVLVNRAHGQDELDEKSVIEAKQKAEKTLSEIKDTLERNEAIASLRRSTIDLKLLTKTKRRSSR
jgi:F-type H+-transporting ATPase subunit epsilon